MACTTVAVTEFSIAAPRGDRRLHVAKVGGVLALLLRGSHAEDVHVREVGCDVVICGEPRTTGSQIVVQQLSQARFVERHITNGR